MKSKNSGKVITGLLVAAMAAAAIGGMTLWRTTANAEAPAKNVVYVTETGTGAKDGTSWANAMAGASLDAAVTKAGTSGYQVWVAKGIYTRTATLNLPKGVRIYGGFEGTEKALSQRRAMVPDEKITSEDSVISRDASVGSDVNFSLLT